MVRGKVKILLAILSLMLVISISIWGVAVLLEKDAERLKGYEQEALMVGRERLEEECLKEGLDSTACKNMNTIVSTSECLGRPCWIVNGRTDDPHGFGGGVFVNIEDGRYTVTEYVRNTGIRQSDHAGE